MSEELQLALVRVVELIELQCRATTKASPSSLARMACDQILESLEVDGMSGCRLCCS
jgi:hypothetical protein